jgi:hypothetical protein
VRSTHRRAWRLPMLVAIVLMPLRGAAVQAGQAAESHQYRH